MKQNDYSNYNQQGQNFRMPAYPQQQMMPSFAPPRPTMQGGNFAPRPMNPQQMQQQGMFPNQPYMQNNDTMPGFEQYYGGQQDWRDVKLGDVRDHMTDAQAEEQLEQYDQMLDQINGQIDTTVATTGNVAQLHSALLFVAKSLREPEGWVPTAQKAQLPKIRTSGEKIGAVLEEFAKQIAKLG